MLSRFGTWASISVGLGCWLTRNDLQQACARSGTSKNAAAQDKFQIAGLIGTLPAVFELNGTIEFRPESADKSPTPRTVGNQSLSILMVPSGLRHTLHESSRAYSPVINESRLGRSRPGLPRMFGHPPPLVMYSRFLSCWVNYEDNTADKH